jgi:hypothetical protein
VWTRCGAQIAGKCRQSWWLGSWNFRGDSARAKSALCLNGFLLRWNRVRPLVMMAIPTSHAVFIENLSYECNCDPSVSTGVSQEQRRISRRARSVRSVPGMPHGHFRTASDTSAEYSLHVADCASGLICALHRHSLFR